MKEGDEVEYVLSLTIKKLEPSPHGEFAYLTDQAGVIYYLPVSSLCPMEEEPITAEDGSC